MHKKYKRKNIFHHTIFHSFRLHLNKWKRFKIFLSISFIFLISSSLHFPKRVLLALALHYLVGQKFVIYHKIIFHLFFSLWLGIYPATTILYHRNTHKSLGYMYFGFSMFIWNDMFK